MMDAQAVTGRADVVVVGGGVSGCSAAKLLQDSGIDVIILEARDRVGGRTYTKRDPSYGYVDVGASYVGPSQDRILRLATELGIKTYKVYDERDYLHYTRGRRIRFQGSWPMFNNPLAWLDVNNLFRVMDKLIEEIPVEAPWDAPRAKIWDRKTMQQWLDSVVWTRDAMEFGAAFVLTNVTMEPHEVSMLWFLWYIKSCGGCRRILEVDNGDQERKFYGGSNQVTERIAERLGNKCILSSPVCTLTDHEQVMLQTTDGRKYQCKHVILAMAPTLYPKVNFDPPLPALKQQLTQRMPMGSCIKNQIWYKTPFWREKGINGYSTVADGIEPVANTVDDTKPDGSHPAITGFIAADKAREMVILTKQERFKICCQYYAKLFGTDEALKPLAYEEHNWLAEQYSGGCYTSTLPPGVLTQYGRELRKAHGHVYFAGTETAARWSGYMDGAVEAGERAAREILHALGKISADQIWQVEPECAEIPSREFNVSWWERTAPSVGGLLQLVLGVTCVTGLASLVYRHYDQVDYAIKTLTK